MSWIAALLMLAGVGYVAEKLKGAPIERRPFLEGDFSYAEGGEAVLISETEVSEPEPQIELPQPSEPEPQFDPYAIYYQPEIEPEITIQVPEIIAEPVAPSPFVSPEITAQAEALRQETIEDIQTGTAIAPPVSYEVVALRMQAQKALGDIVDNWQTTWRFISTTQAMLDDLNRAVNLAIQSGGDFGALMNTVVNIRGYIESGLGLRPPESPD